MAAAVVVFAVVGGVGLVTIPVDATPQALGGTWTVFGVGDGLPGQADTLAVSPDGNVWAAQLDSVDGFSADGLPLQLYRYDNVAGWQPLGAPLAGVENLQWIAEDADGSVVAAVCLTGNTAWHLARFANDSWEVFEDPAIACGRIEAHTMPDGSLLIAGHAAASDSPLLVTIEDGTPVSRLTQIVQEGERRDQDAIVIVDSGTAWFAGMSELISFDGSNTVRYQFGPTGGEYFSTVVVAPDGSIWSQGINEIAHISLSGELVRYGEPAGVPRTPLGIDHPEWRLVPATDGQLWAFREDVIVHYDGDTWRTYQRPV